MNLNQHNILLKSIWEVINKTRLSGQKEYAADQENVFANFDRIAKQLKLDKKGVLWVYLMKHVDGVASYIKGHHSQREDVRGRMTDIIVYLSLLWGMIEEESAEEKPDEEFKPEYKGEWTSEPDRFK